MNNGLSSFSSNDSIFWELELILNSTQDALFLVEERENQFYYIRNNRTHEELTGFHLDKLHNHTPFEILGPEAGLRLTHHMHQCLLTKSNISFEESLVFQHKQLFLLTKLSPFFHPNGQRFIVGSRVDISWIKDEVTQGEEQIQKFTEMFEKHTAIMLLIEPETGQIIDANSSACEFYGYSLKILKSMSIQDINMMTPEKIRILRLNALQKQQKYFLFPHKKKDGTICMVDVYSSPIHLAGVPYLYSIIFDVTERERTRSELFREKEFLKITLTSIGDGVITIDNFGIITQVNQAALRILRSDSQEIIGSSFYDTVPLYQGNTAIRLPDLARQVICSSTAIELDEETTVLTKEGNRIPIADSLAPILNENGDVYGAVMVFRDISAERARKQHIMYLSYHDNLTGLYNRRYFDDIISSIDIPSSYPLAVIMGDVNGLKITNDVFGHEMGDQLLKSIAEIILENTSSTDLPIRWGGDEFVIFMPQTDTAQANTFLSNIQTLLQKKQIHKIVKMSISFGVAIKTKQEELIDHLLKKAEELMYQKKLLESKSLRNSILNSVLSTLDERSFETKEHANRLDFYCQKIAISMNLSPDEISELSLLSVLHDIGKIGIDPHILNKPGPLNETEWIEIRKHSEIGYRIAQSIPELSNVADHILYHHERWDGCGYPGGLKGASIPLLCRILSIADAYDAMINDRIYRKAMPSEHALDEILRNSGTQFDPQIVIIFQHLYIKKDLETLEITKVQKI